MNRTGFERSMMRVSGVAALSALVIVPSVTQAMPRERNAAREESGVHHVQTPIDHIVINSAPGTLFAGTTVSHTAKGICKDGTERRLSPVWRSSDPDIATVDRAGNVTAKKVGIVTITAEADGVRGAKTYAVTKKPAEKFLIDLPSKPIRAGDIV